MKTEIVKTDNNISEEDRRLASTFLENFAKVFLTPEIMPKKKTDKDR